MAIKSPSLLWNIDQNLGKTDKKKARSNAGVDSIMGTSGKGDHTFLTHISENSSGNLVPNYRQPAIADISDINKVKVFYATQSNTFDEVKAAYDGGQLILFVEGGIVFMLNEVKKSGNTITSFEFANLYNSPITVDTERRVYDVYVDMDAWSCLNQGNPWYHYDRHYIRLATDTYCQYRTGKDLQPDDEMPGTGDKLIITKGGVNGESVRSSITFDSNSNKGAFLSKVGYWQYGMAIDAITFEANTDYTSWDSLLTDRFYFIYNSPNPSSSNSSPEGGQLFALTGYYEKTGRDDYPLCVQLAMGDHLYYRHSIPDAFGDEIAGWSDWVNVSAEYTAGTDLILNNGVFSVNTSSTMDTYSSGVNARGFVLGGENEMEHSLCSVVGGYVSKMYGGTNSLVFGWRNKAGNDPTVDAETGVSSYKTFVNAFVVGSENTLQSSDHNFIWGHNNTIASTPDSSGIVGATGDNIAFGDTNIIGGGTHNILIGKNNWLTMDTSQTVASHIIMLGHDLEWKKSNANDMLILGRYNLKDDYFHNDGVSSHPIRMTGAGIDDSNRDNIEELYPNGILWVKRSVETATTVGDITYTNSIYMEPTTGAGGVNSVLTYSEDAMTGGVEFTRNFTKFSYMSPSSVGLSNVKSITNVTPGRTSPESGISYNAQLISISKGADDEYGIVNGMPTKSIALEFASGYLGSSGIALTRTGIPAWNSSTASTLEASWLTIFGHRDYTSTLPWEAKPGNLEVGKIAVKYFWDYDLQVDTVSNINNAIIPGEKVGELTFIIGTSNNGFWIHDDYYNGNVPTVDYLPDPSGIGSSHRITSYVRANTFCILITTKPTVWNQNTNPPEIIELGEFKALVSANF